jgi:transcriptional regulator with XRE-family HTH domain
MKKDLQKNFYEKVGAYLKNERIRRNITITQLANKAGEQFNTVKAIEEGNNFHFHQAVWIAGVLGININEMIRITIGGETNDDCIDLADFI